MTNFDHWPPANRSVGSAYVATARHVHSNRPTGNWAYVLGNNDYDRVVILIWSWSNNMCANRAKASAHLRLNLWRTIPNLRIHELDIDYRAKTVAHLQPIATIH